MKKDFINLKPIDHVAQNILEKRYLWPGESSWEDVVDRVIAHVASKDDGMDIPTLRDMMLNRYFIPNSPTLFNSGKADGGLSACFVVDFPDTTEGIMKTFADFVYIARKGGGCGTTLSNLRPEGDPVAGSSHGYAIGPINAYDALCHLMKQFTQGGVRPMAMMATMSVRHPDILKFIRAKSEEGKMTTTNISVVVDDQFMEAVENDETYWTEFNGYKYEELRARDVFQEMVEGAWRNGEPGIIFDEKINASPYAMSGQEIQATNPCGEQPIPPNGVCNLGSLDISKFSRKGSIDWVMLNKAVRIAVRFLDNVIDRQEFPTKDIEKWAKENRPIGLGIMGFADHLISKEIAYGSLESLKELDSIMGYVYSVAKMESMTLGQERGIPKSCKKLREKRRNITLTSIAPTGTISLLSGCSSGIEPIFSEVMVRTDGTGTYQITHPDYDEPYFRCAVASNGATEVTWEEHLAIQDIASKWVDSGVSKTINCPQGTRKETIWKIFMEAWKLPYIKGLTVYRNQSRKQEVLTPKNLKKNLCPICKGNLVKEGGCTHCDSCDYSVCEIG